MMNLVFRLFSTPANLAPTILRLLLAAVFCVHGGQETLGWMGGAGWNATLERLTGPHGLNLSYPLAMLAIAAETVGGVGMFLGSLTRVMALAIMGVMVMLAAAEHGQSGFTTPEGYEYPLTLGAVAFSLLCSGGGRFSVDRLIARRLLPPNTGMLGSYRHYSVMN